MRPRPGQPAWWRLRLAGRVYRGEHRTGGSFRQFAAGGGGVQRKSRAREEHAVCLWREEARADAAGERALAGGPPCVGVRGWRPRAQTGAAAGRAAVCAARLPSELSGRRGDVAERLRSAGLVCPPLTEGRSRARPQESWGHSAPGLAIVMHPVVIRFCI